MRPARPVPPFSGSFGQAVYLFGTSIDKFLTSLVLGFAALLAAIKAGIPVGGAASAVLLGITIGILADDALISRLK
jgi:hypothetical protein